MPEKIRFFVPDSLYSLFPVPRSLFPLSPFCLNFVTQLI
ncbi:hypothetical protein CKA32_005001 [Geitlerinema sp. FC II]|nr:hypothetical protein CKA32_005001 [Geitlerinema sp. FC II]